MSHNILSQNSLSYAKYHLPLSNIHRHQNVDPSPLRNRQPRRTPEFPYIYRLDLKLVDAG